MLDHVTVVQNFPVLSHFSQNKTLSLGIARPYRICPATVSPPHMLSSPHFLTPATLDSLLFFAHTPQRVLPRGLCTHSVPSRSLGQPHGQLPHLRITFSVTLALVFYTETSIPTPSIFYHSSSALFSFPALVYFTCPCLSFSTKMRAP